jgi:hypothetical protein
MEDANHFQTSHATFELTKPPRSRKTVGPLRSLSATRTLASIQALLLRVFVTAMAATLWTNSAFCQGDVTLEAQPSSVEVSQWYHEVQARVTFKNGGTDVLEQPKLDIFTNDSFQLKIDPTPIKRVRPGQTLVWPITLMDVDRARIPGTVQFDATYIALGKRGLRHAYATLSVKRAVQQENPVEVSIQGLLDPIAEYRPSVAYITINNNLEIPVKTSVTMRPPQPYTVECKTAVSLDVPAHSTEIAEMVVSAASQVTPGRYVIEFPVRAEWDEAGHRQVRLLTVNKEVSVGVFVESDLLKVLGIPSFLILPGALVLFTMQLLLSFGFLRLNHYSKVPELPVTAPGFWVIAITVSGLFAVVYEKLTRTDFLIGYGSRDLRNVWLSSIVLGLSVYVLFAWITYKRRKDRVPDYNDDQIVTLKKMGRRGLGILANRIAFQINNVQRTAFLIELIEDNQTMVWVAPRLVLSWDASTTEAQQAQTEITNEIDNSQDPYQIAKAIDAAKKKGYIALRWDTHNSVSNP